MVICVLVLLGQIISVVLSFYIVLFCLVVRLWLRLMVGLFWLSSVCVIPFFVLVVSMSPIATPSVNSSLAEFKTVLIHLFLPSSIGISTQSLIVFLIIVALLL